MNPEIVLKAIIAAALRRYRIRLLNDAIIIAETGIAGSYKDAKTAYETDPDIKMFTDALIMSIYDWKDLFFTKND